MCVCVVRRTRLTLPPHHRLERVLLDSAKSYIDEKIDRAKKARKKLDAFTPTQEILHELKIALLAESVQDLKLCVGPRLLCSACILVLCHVC